MSYLKAERTYKCYEDCNPQEGCPGHKLTVEFFSASPCYLILDDGKSISGLCPNLMDALIDILIEFGEQRADVVQIMRKTK